MWASIGTSKTAHPAGPDRGCAHLRASRHLLAQPVLHPHHRGAGRASRHWLAGGGHAVDLYSLNGHATNGADSNALRLIAVLDPLMPAGSEVGQRDCRAAAGTPTGTTHMSQIDVDPATITPLRSGPGG